MSAKLARLEPEADGDRRVLADLVHVLVHAQLVVGQRRLVVPAVGQHAEALVDEALVVELLERPQDRLHERRVERLVVVLEVDPARLAGHVVLPLARVLEHRRAARVVEPLDPQLEDLLLGLDPELVHRLELGGQAVRVPAEATLDVLAAHRLVARHDVLRVAREQVPVVGQAVGEGRAVVEHELVAAVLPGGVALDRGAERVVRLPVGEDLALDRGQVRGGGDAERGSGVRVGGGRGCAVQRVGHGLEDSGEVAVGGVSAVVVRVGRALLRGRLPHLGRVRRGTTSLAGAVPAGARRRRAPRAVADRSSQAVTGPPVRV